MTESTDPTTDLGNDNIIDLSFSEDFLEGTADVLTEGDYIALSDLGFDIENQFVLELLDQAWGLSCPEDPEGPDEDEGTEGSPLVTWFYADFYS